MKKFIEDWSKWLPFTTLLVIFGGDLYLFSYYNHFNINLFYFISPSDVLSLFFTDFIGITLIIPISVGLAVAITLTVRTRLFEKHHNNQRKTAQLKALAGYRKLHYRFVFWLFITVCYGIHCFFPPNNYHRIDKSFLCHN